MAALPDLIVRVEVDYFEKYRALAKAICRMQGLDPDEIISDHGHECWELVGYETVQQEVRDNETFNHHLL